MSKLIDLTSKRFGKLTVLERAENHISKSGYSNIMWKCQCDCGNITIVSGGNLRNGSTKTCGCSHLKRDGKSHKRLFGVWTSMISRCENKKNKSYKNYGDRVIKVCDAWHDYSVFEKWAYEAGYDDNASYGDCTLDRIDVNGNYCPENCRWVNEKIQCNNRRNNYYIEIDGVTKTLTEWAELSPVPRNTIKTRLDNGWSHKDALTIPSKQMLNPTVTPFTMDGETKMISEWLKQYNTSPRTFSDRRRNHWDIERAIKEPLHNNGKRKGV